MHNQSPEITALINNINCAVDQMITAVQTDIEETTMLFNIYIAKAQKVARKEKIGAKAAKAQKAIYLFQSIIDSHKLPQLIEHLQCIKEINTLISTELNPRKTSSNLSFLSYTSYICEISNLCVAQLRLIKQHYKAHLNNTHSSLLPLWYDREIANSIDLFVFTVTKNYKTFETIFNQLNIDYADLSFMALDSEKSQGDIWGLKVVLRMVSNRLNCPEQKSVLDSLFPNLNIDNQTVV